MNLNHVALGKLVSRAKSAIDQGVVYRLGRGGFNPKHPKVGWDKGWCDCSGFVSWVLQTRRIPKPLRPFWIETTAVWNDAKGKQKAFVQIVKPVEGCIVVFPDYRRDGRKHEGHIGIVSSVTSSSVYHVVDCASRGIAEHRGDYFLAHGAIFCVHKDQVLS